MTGLPAISNVWRTVRNPHPCRNMGFVMPVPMPSGIPPFVMSCQVHHQVLPTTVLRIIEILVDSLMAERMVRVDPTKPP